MEQSIPTRIAEGGPKAAVVLFSVFANGCAIQWRGSEGVDHHLGFFANHVVELAAGTRLRRITFGLDLRLSGEDPGISLGLKVLESTRPHFATVGPERLGAQVLAALERQQSMAPRTPGSWSLFYHTEDVSSRSTLLRSFLVGLEWTGGSTKRGLDIGYSSSSHFVGTALAEDRVQVHIADTDDRDRARLMLWALAPRDRQDP
jgi:hypothetical protein